MKVLMPGGTGHVGQALRRHLEPAGWQFVVLTRNPKAIGEFLWDGKSVGDWAEHLEGADVVINLAGRTVNCRYTEANLAQMMDSRVLSVRALGEAIRRSDNPPKVWLQASTATIYAHRYDAANDELTGIIGGEEVGAPYKWNESIKIARAWEAELDRAITPHTRKVAMRSAMTMSVDNGSVLDVFVTLARRGLGGSQGMGNQFVSWVHEADFARAIQFLVKREDMSGPVNLCSPNPIPNREFMQIIRETVAAKVALPTPNWLLEIGAVLLGTETELILKSRRVVPTRLLEAGFEFLFPNWEDACRDLVVRLR